MNDLSLFSVAEIEALNQLCVALSVLWGNVRWEVALLDGIAYAAFLQSGEAVLAVSRAPTGPPGAWEVVTLPGEVLASGDTLEAACRAHVCDVAESLTAGLKLVRKVAREMRYAAKDLCDGVWFVPPVCAA